MRKFESILRGRIGQLCGKIANYAELLEQKTRKNRSITPKIANYTEVQVTIKLFLKEFYLIVILVLINKPFIYEAARSTIMRLRSVTLRNKMAPYLFSRRPSVFSNALLISLAPLSLLRFPLAFWALKLVNLSNSAGII